MKEFQYCFDRAPAVPFDEIKSILREELAVPIDSIYEYVDPTPLASASIAQVDIIFCKSEIFFFSKILCHNLGNLIFRYTQQGLKDRKQM